MELNRVIRIYNNSKWRLSKKICRLVIKRLKVRYKEKKRRITKN
jgi:hypothetical protein